MILKRPERFFSALRTGLLGPTLSPDEVSGCDAILAACKGWPVSWVAYALATAYHETGHTMQPVREKGSGDGPDPDKWDDYLEKYDTGHLARQLGNTPAADGDGVKYAGRGYVQLTGRANYERAAEELGEPFLAKPDLALEPEHAAAIMERGMREGWFTGRRLDSFLPNKGAAQRFQFLAARRIINGQDRADLIADYALRFQDALLVAA